jgi:hypothetical protein
MYITHTHTHEIQFTTKRYYLYRCSSIMATSQTIVFYVYMGSLSHQIHTIRMTLSSKRKSNLGVIKPFSSLPPVLRSPQPFRLPLRTQSPKRCYSMFAFNVSPNPRPRRLPELSELPELSGASMRVMKTRSSQPSWKPSGPSYAALYQPMSSRDAYDGGIM